MQLEERMGRQLADTVTCGCKMHANAAKMLTAKGINTPPAAMMRDLLLLSAAQPTGKATMRFVSPLAASTYPAWAFDPPMSSYTYDASTVPPHTDSATPCGHMAESSVTGQVTYSQGMKNKECDSLHAYAFAVNAHHLCKDKRVRDENIPVGSADRIKLPPE
eukprot:6174079-Pleurochrysis_carterae.AAC.1